MKLTISMLLITLCSISLISGCTIDSKKRNEAPTNLHSGTELPSDNAPNDTPTLTEEIEKEIALTGSREVSWEYDTSLTQVEMLFE